VGVSRAERLKGARFGQHEIVRFLGHGATASVFEARHVALGKRVAIKLLHEHLAQDEQLAARFLREGQIAARLRHPNAVDVVDVGVEAGVPYLVMELLEGGDLRSLLADVKVLTVEHALAFLLPIASALAHAHDLGVLHRDLKPANIFLARDVRDEVVPKLVDFGLSKSATGESSSSLTATELVAGTVLYMAPEQTNGVKFASPASDQYSLASVLYECVTGELPFMDENVYGLIEKIRKLDPRPPSHVRRELAPAIDGPILRGLARDPAGRYPDVRAFARDLLAFADPRTASAVERDFVERVSGGTKAASHPSIRRASAAMPAAPRSSSSSLSETRPSSSGVRTPANRDVVSPLPVAPGTSPFHIKGMSYRGLVTFAAKVLPGGLDALVAAFEDDRLGPFMRQPFLASARYDILPLVPIFAAAARVLGVPMDTLVRTTTAEQARYDARKVYKRIFDANDVAAVAERFARFNTQMYDFGRYESSVPEPGQLVIIHAEMPAYVRPWYGPMHEAYTRAAMEILGAKEITMLSATVEPAGSKGAFPLVTFRTEYRWR
jgi:serine/threonine protein kinase